MYKAHQHFCDYSAVLLGTRTRCCTTLLFGRLHLHRRLPREALPPRPPTSPMEEARRERYLPVCMYAVCVSMRLSANADVAFAVSGCRICLLLFSSPTHHLLSLSCRIGHPADQDVNVPLGKASLQTSRRTLSLSPHSQTHPRQQHK